MVDRVLIYFVSDSTRSASWHAKFSTSLLGGFYTDSVGRAVHRIWTRTRQLALLLVTVGANLLSLGNEGISGTRCLVFQKATTKSNTPPTVQLALPSPFQVPSGAIETACPLRFSPSILSVGRSIFQTLIRCGSPSLHLPLVSESLK